VVDDLGLTSTHTETITVSAPLPGSDQPTDSTPSDSSAPQGFDTPPAPVADPAPANPLVPAGLAQFNPRPFVRIKGHTTGRGAQIDLFSVRALGGSRVAVRCQGKHCPKHSAVQRLIKGSRTGTVRFRPVEGFLVAGIVLEVRVTKKGYVGRYTRFRIGKLKPPVRWDGCLMPGAKGPSEC
jgi:hypothetical protein